MSDFLEVLFLMALPMVWLTLCRYLIQRESHRSIDEPAAEQQT